MSKKNNIKRIACLCLILTSLSLMHFESADASTILEVSTSELIVNSVLVFEGVVINKESKFTENNSSINTYIKFNIIQILKGDYTNSDLELRFAGGQVGDIKMKVSDSHLPSIGEHGIYFVESIENTLVNPLYGWSQGHFIIIKTANGQELITTPDNKIVNGITISSKQVPKISNGIAKGISIKQKNDNTPALTKDAFVEGLKVLIRETN